ncbi:MAG: 3D domain-containing protein [Phycisphaerae bacterium]
MSRSGKKLLLLFPLFVVALVIMHHGRSDPADTPTPAGRHGSLPALAAWETTPRPVQTEQSQPPAQTSPEPAPVNRPNREQERETVTVRMLVTAYCPCAKCCGAYSDGITASGKDIYTNNSRFVAADTDILPFGTRVSIPGYNEGEAVPVLDCGGAIKGYHLDVFFLSHQRALEWGRQWVDVTVYLD